MFKLMCSIWQQLETDGHHINGLEVHSSQCWFKEDIRHLWVVIVCMRQTKHQVRYGGVGRSACSRTCLSDGSLAGCMEKILMNILGSPFQVFSPSLRMHVPWKIQSSLGGERKTLGTLLLTCWDKIPGRLNTCGPHGQNKGLLIHVTGYPNPEHLGRVQREGCEEVFEYCSELE